MTPKTFSALVVVAVLVSGAALFSANERYGKDRSDRSESILFPNLLARVNDVSRVDIIDVENTITIEQYDSKWLVTSKNRFPADGAKVREAVFGLSQLRTIESKTAMAERYSRLEVQNVTEPSAKSHLWRLKNVEDEVVAEIIVGRQRFDLGGVESRGVYVRKAGEAQSWLARGKLPIDQRPVQWLDRTAMDIQVDRVHRVTTINTDDARFTTIKDAPGDEHFRIDNLPKDFILNEEWQKDITRLGTVLSGLRLDDVEPVENFDFSSSDVVRAEVESFGGLIVRISMRKIANGGIEKWWVIFETAVAPNAKALPNFLEEKVAGESVPPKEHPDANARIGTPKEILLEVEAINKRVKGWAYHISEYRAKPMHLRLTDLEAKSNFDQAL
jgi:hypothetical protein